MRVLPMGPTAVLVEQLGADPAAWSAALTALGLPGVVDIVPAAATVLVRCNSPEALAQVLDKLDRVQAEEMVVGSADLVVEVPVVYDGDDLAELAATVGRSSDEVVALHSEATYTVAFCGFAPGFAYLRGLPAALHVPRRHTPRTRVPAGAVAVAAEYSAVYPRHSPGGWHLVGTTRLQLFDPLRDPPALLVPGGRVRFVPS